MSNESDPNGIDQHAAGAKLDDGKIQAGVLKDFSLALTAIAEVGSFGANKYTRGGWQSVPNGIERYEDAFWRHLLKERHEPVDEDSGLLHQAHLAWNILARLEMTLRKNHERIDNSDLNKLLTKAIKVSEKSDD
ncbi:hypothetical protein KAR91_63385 [Candidatus Pacearchaeota archaeon]|nr:hypothetical protein [Candidatus Pacearchaeota archaeon]